MQDFSLCKAYAIGISKPKQTMLKSDLIKCRFAVRVMKLTAFILLAGLLHVSAKSPAQGKITIKEKDASLVKIFTQINKQTGYNFLFTNEEMRNAKPVTIEVKNAALKDVLEICFKNQPFSYTVSGNIIAILSKKNQEGDNGKNLNSGAPIDIRGKVFDENGRPVVGATVNIKGTKKNTTTDQDGEFRFTQVEKDATLVFSSVNMEPFQYFIAGQTEVVIRLKTKTSQLDEVQIIAYGQTTKRFLTGNVGTVKSTEIERQPVGNALLALEGRVPGLFITQNTGISGGGVTVRILGQNSIQSGNDPLYIVDGMPISSQLPQTGLEQLILGTSGTVAAGSLQASGNPLTYLNPSDIESIEILKDAEATAIYGSRAANGAILITTKKGKAGKTTVDINMNQGWGSVTRKLDLLNTRQYLDMRYEAYKNDGLDWRDPSVSANDLKIWDTTRYTDWQKELIGRTAHLTNVNATLSGGTTAIQYVVSGTYRNETTVFPLPSNFSDKKGSLHFNLNNASTTSRLRFQLTANYLLDNNRLPSADLTQSAVQTEPVAPSLYNADGSLNWALTPSGRTTFVNPLANQLKEYNNKTNNLVSNAEIGYQILTGLDLSSSFGYTNTQTDDFLPTPLLSIRPEWRNTVQQRSAAYGERNLNSYNIEPKITYKRTIRKLKAEALLGSTILQSRASGKTLQGTGYTSDQILKDVRAAANLSVSNSFESQYKYNAFFGRLSFNWQDKYILNVSARRDGSSRFGPANQFHNFGAVGGAWIFSKENVFKENVSWLSFGKLRVSYGTTGNDQIADYLYLSTYNSLYGVQVPYQGVTSTMPTSLPNPYIQWEQTRKFQVGFDLGLLRDRILLNATYARNRSSNQLTPYTVPVTTGFDNYIQNFPATVQNTSLEFSLSTTNISRKNIKWTSNFNLTIPRNKLIAFPNLSTSSYANTLIIGQPVNIIKVFHMSGVNQTTGLYEFIDSNGNVTNFPTYGIDNNTVISTAPKVYGGFQNGITYKGISIDFLLQFVKQVGQNLSFGYPSNIATPGSFFRGASNQPVTVLDRWRKAGDNVPIQRYSSFLGDPGVNYAFSSDAAFSDASYLRLKNISISYSLPANWIRKISLQNCRFYIQGQNLLTFTSYKGLDPENQSFIALPPLKMLTIGFQVQL